MRGGDVHNRGDNRLDRHPDDHLQAVAGREQGKRHQRRPEEQVPLNHAGFGGKRSSVFLDDCCLRRRLVRFKRKQVYF